LSETRGGTGGRAVLFLAAALLAASSCAVAPAHLRGEAEPSGYPRSRFLTAAASSETSSQEADAAAKVGIAQQIDSRIVAEFESLQREIGRGESVSASHEVSQRVVQQASFRRADLIEIAERGSWRGTHYSLAVLSREKAARALGQDYRSRAGAFREACAAALASEARPAAFTAAWHAARRGWMDLGTAGQELAAVDPSHAEEVHGDARRLGTLRAARTRVMQALAFRVEARAAGAPADERFAQAVRAALTSLGLRTDRATGALQLQAGADESFPRGLGACCEWRPLLVLEGTALALESELTGCHPKDRAQARAELESRLEGAVRAPLRRALAATVPWDEE